MTAWPGNTFAEIADGEELIIVASRAGRETKRVPVWVVGVDGDIYVRSYKGVTSLWFRRAEAEPDQVVALDSGDIPIRFENVDRTDHVNAAISRAYDAKYDSYSYVSAMSEPAAVEATLRVLPRD